jgi:sulfate/thiosulfate-binding protein
MLSYHIITSKLARGAATLLAGAAVLLAGSAFAQSLSLLNVSYDPTRELYAAYNKEFVKYWEEKTGQKVTINQSHGGAGKQARAVIDGLPADVVTLALAYDINAIAREAKLLPENWQIRLPYNSSPYTSTIVFLVRKTNPKNIKDWGDLVKGDIEIITPNPKTSGGARWNYLAAWAWALRQELGDTLPKDADPAALEAAQAKAKAYITELYKRVPVLDSGARGSTTTFLQRGIGDVFLSWENEAHLAVKELGKGAVEIVYPPSSILTEPPVSLVDKNAEKHGTTELANEYLKYLYSAAGQTVAAKYFYRPITPELADPEDVARFPQLDLFTIEDYFGGWDEAQKTHFEDGGTFDQIYQP